MPKPGCPEQSGLCDDAATFLLWKVARPQAEYPLKQNRDFAAAAASDFLCGQKVTKEPLRERWISNCPYPFCLAALDISP